MSKNTNKPLSKNPTWQAIGAYAEAKEEIERLTAEKVVHVQQGIRDHGDWRSKLNFLESDYKAEIARLTAENERLRKIGFEMRKMIGDHAWTLAWDAECKYSPYAAKEGSDAK